MRKLSTGPLDEMLAEYDEVQETLEHVRREAEQRKLLLIQFAVDQNMLDCLTLNINKLRQAV